MNDNKKVIVALGAALVAAGAFEGIKKIINNFQKNSENKINSNIANSIFTKTLLVLEKDEQKIIIRMLSKMESWQKDEFILSVGNIVQTIMNGHFSEDGLKEGIKLLRLFIDVGTLNDKDNERIKLAINLNLINKTKPVSYFEKIRSEVSEDFESFTRNLKIGIEKKRKEYDKK